MAFDWVCPFCDRAQTVVDSRMHQREYMLGVGESSDGYLMLQSLALCCVSKGCRKTSVHVLVYGEQIRSDGSRTGEIDPTDLRLSRRLLPEGKAKSLPEYIPEPLREDYREACLIRELSPKASATLIRRCIQGMIRDFCKISKKSLFQEIQALREAIDGGNGPRGVSYESVDAIDEIRSIGNIGAHMEKDINIIVDVEPEEAQLLIELTELLFEEWYVASHKRQLRLDGVKALAEEKRLLVENQKNGATETNE